MIINEAIIYAEEMAATDGNRKRQDNYNQIAEWLKDYKRMLQQEPCEDCISRQAVIDACDQSINLFEAVDRIKELAPVTSKPKTGHWVPVSGRLPEEDGEYLVTVKRGYVATGLWVGNAGYWNEVIAWMPLPEPYKVESERENSNDD